jgi:hypothetical protein
MRDRERLRKLRSPYLGLIVLLFCHQAIYVEVKTPQLVTQEDRRALDESAEVELRRWAGIKPSKYWPEIVGLSPSPGRMTACMPAKTSPGRLPDTAAPVLCVKGSRASNSIRSLMLSLVTWLMPRRFENSGESVAYKTPLSN